MRNRVVVLGSLAGFVAGLVIGVPLGIYWPSPGPKFPSLVEEYRYLRGVPAPTPEQYIRLKELEEMPAPPGLTGTVKDAARGADGWDSLPRSR